MATIPEQIAQNLSAQDLLASFGEERAAALVAGATSRFDGLRTLQSTTAVEVVDLASIGD